MARSQWKSKYGFILAAAGSAVGLGNLWKFPYIAGVNGGGAFVLFYLVCIALVGMPIMIGEIMIGRATQKSPVPAFRDPAIGGKHMWSMVGWMGVAAGFLILSFYSVVAGWALHYIKLYITGGVSGTPDEISAVFTGLFGNAQLNMLWHTIFMGLTTGIVIGGVSGGIEKAAKIFVPALFVMLAGLVIMAFRLDGFEEAMGFIFGAHTDKFTAEGALEALGHSFFTLSLGMGALLTYGSYLGKTDDIIQTSFSIALLDTIVALMACMILFPVVFTFGMDPSQGPGLAFVNMPIAMSKLAGGTVVGLVFFTLLLFAALTSAVSLMEVVVASVIDLLGWNRKKTSVVVGIAIYVFGIPSALTGSVLAGKKFLLGKDFLDSVDYLTSNWFLPLGGLFVAIFAGWVIPAKVSRREFGEGREFFHAVWLWLCRTLAPASIAVVIAIKAYHTFFPE